MKIEYFRLGRTRMWKCPRQSHILSNKYLILSVFDIMASMCGSRLVIYIYIYNNIVNCRIHQSYCSALLSTCMVIKLSGQGQSKGHKLHGNRLICQMSNFEPHSQTENLHFPSKPTIFHAETGKNSQALKIMCGIVPMLTSYKAFLCPKVPNPPKNRQRICTAVATSHIVTLYLEKMTPNLPFFFQN